MILRFIKATQWLTFLHHIWMIPEPNVVMKLGYFEREYLRFSSVTSVEFRP